MTAIGSRLSKLKTYPYANARVRAMRADLVTDAEYRKLAKMTLAEIAEFLSSRGYSREIEELGDQYEGEELIERALQRNLSRTYMKLIRISPDEVDDLLWAYYRKFDIHNLKTLLRHTMRDADEDITPVLIPTPTMNRETLQQYLEMDATDDIIDAFTTNGFDGDLHALLDDAETLQEMEDALDGYYYLHLQEQAAEAGIQSDLFTKFLQLEAALANIRLILRMKRQDYTYDEIMDRIVDLPKNMQIVDNQKLAQTDSYDQALALVRESQISEHLEETITSPAEVSRALDAHKLRTGIEMLHKDQLSVNPLLGFMICKEIEVSNLRMLVRAKEEELGEDFIERNLIRGVATQ